MHRQFHADFFRNARVRQRGIETVPERMKRPLGEIPNPFAFDHARINAGLFHNAFEHFAQSVFPARSPADELSDTDNPLFQTWKCISNVQ